MRRNLLVALGLSSILLGGVFFFQHHRKAVIQEGEKSALAEESENVSPEVKKSLPETEEDFVLAKEEVTNLPKEIVDPAAVEKAAERAAALTGVRKDFLLGVLAVETTLGENVGQCTYKEVSDGAEAAHRNGQLSGKSWETFQNRRVQIQGLAKELGYDVNGLKVSCNPNPSQYVGTGGAMGISQFMPSTWYEYRERIAKISGKEHPDPWNIEDGVLAMALKLGDVPGVTQHDLASEKRASKMYLSGSVSEKYDWYANNIQYWAENNHEILGEQYIMSLIFE